MTGTARPPGQLRNRSRAAAFLGYHSVAPDGPPFLSIPPERFERQLWLLRRMGYSAGTLPVLEELSRGARPGRKHVFLSFDDGYADNYTHALPLLRQYGLTALFFILPLKVDEGGALDWPAVRERHDAYPTVMRSMTWPNVEEMIDAGMEFGSHTLTHPHLPEVGDDDELAQELLDSRRRIADRIGHCDSLAYPFGSWDGRVALAAARAGYRFAFTMPFGAQTRATTMSIPRIAIDHRDGPPRFALKRSSAGRGVLLSRLKPALRRASRRPRR